jgi:hypothetical protein
LVNSNFTLQATLPKLGAIVPLDFTAVAAIAAATAIKLYLLPLAAAYET